MAATPLVPCYYTGQNYRWERPAKILPRVELHELKKRQLGLFREGGRIFVFFKRIEQAARILSNGPLGIGNLLPFAKAHNYGDKLHYEIPHAGDRGAFARHRSRNLRVSSRNLFAKQPIPAVPLTA